MVPAFHVCLRPGLWDLPPHCTLPVALGSDLRLPGLPGWLAPSPTATSLHVPPHPGTPWAGLLFPGSQAVQLVLWAGEGVEDKQKAVGGSRLPVPEQRGLLGPSPNTRFSQFPRWCLCKEDYFFGGDWGLGEGPLALGTYLNV